MGSLKTLSGYKPQFCEPTHQEIRQFSQFTPQCFQCCVLQSVEGKQSKNKDYKTITVLIVTMNGDGNLPWRVSLKQWLSQKHTTRRHR